ncbi:MAG: hypothetical protein U9Q96_01555 [Patescibacteria group bacterium]|nr:hypothetical protein [Patescibacteria group bacterium]
MHEIVHIAFALFLLKIFQNPLVVFPLAFISHFLLDIVPHYKSKRSTRKSFIVEILIDVFISMVFVLFYFIYAQNLPNLFILLITCFFAVLPDFFLILNWLYGIEILKPFLLDFHRKIQHEYSWGWIIELGVLAFLLFFLF